MEVDQAPSPDFAIQPVETSLSRHLSSGLTQSIVHQACDECRARKRKCRFTSVDNDPVRLRWPLLNKASLDASSRCCHSCTRLGLACTFLVPVKIRGRKKRARADSFSTVQSSLATREPSQDREALSAGTPPFGPSSPKLDQALHRICSPHTLASDGSNAVGSPPLVNAVAVGGPKYPTDELCSRKLLLQLMDDYLERIYPVLPVVHRPTFQADLARNRDLSDPEFYTLVICLAAVTVALLPERFQTYKTPARPDGLRFQSRTDMINACFDMYQRARGADYFDRISLRKWACSSLIFNAFFQVGQRNRSRMAEVESIQFARMLGLHRIEEYQNLNYIETQLRKKAFWIMFYGYVHLELQNLRRDIVTFLDPIMLQQTKLEDLLPLDVDDELILEHTILPGPAISAGSGSILGVPPSITSAFILHSRVFWAALNGGASPLPFSSSFCECEKARRPSLYLGHWRERLYELRYMLDEVPDSLRQWERTSAGNGQFEILRANLHVTNLWLQSIIMDKIESVLQTHTPNSTTSPVATEASPGNPATGGECLTSMQRRWVERDFICRQLLHVLHSIAYEHLEPNGLYLAYKIRDVAVSLLTCPFEPNEAPARRAADYLRQFTRLLSRLDGSEEPNTLSVQSWIDSDRQPI